MNNIKVSIITTCLNSEKTIAYTLNSVFQQTYKKYIEHILVDGGSTDSTVNIIKKHKLKNKKIITTKNLSIYSSLNLGIKKSTGDFILILNSDDILCEKTIIQKIVKIIKRSKEKLFLGNVIYFNSFFFDIIKRFYSSKNFKTWQLYLGHMPPHPGAFVHKSIAKKYLYDPQYKIAADFDFFLRVIKVKKIPFKIVNKIITRMKTGGISGKNLTAHFISTREIIHSLKKNKILSSYFLVNLRYFLKIFQFLFIKFKVNKFKILPIYSNLVHYHFKIIKKTEFLNFNKNFVLSALNLSFLGSYANGDIKLYKNLVHWPDGVFAEKLHPKLEKIPGRKLLDKIIIPQKYKKIIVFGNLEPRSFEYLKNKYKKEIINYDLPYGDIDVIKKNLNYSIKKNEIIMITLPTPKQEQLAEYLISNNKNYKIICIGGSVNISSGIETAVPDFLYTFEFLWRLRYETKRRLIRLLVTLKNYLLGKYVNGTLKDLKIKIIE